MLLPALPTGSLMATGKMNTVVSPLMGAKGILYSRQVPSKRWQSVSPSTSKPVHLPRAAQAISSADNSDDKPKLHSIFHVFSDPKCNSKLLALCIGQMLCSVATLIHDSYLPVYVQDELGLSNTKIGAVQGAAQFLCQLSKGVSGVAGDMLGSQVRVLFFGTFLTLMCKPMFMLLSTVYGIAGVGATVYWFFFAKLLDRLSKGIREAPTKAVMNELARESGDAPDAAYGLRQSLATVGALVGSTIAAVVFTATGQNYVLTFATAIVPPAVALVWLASQFGEELLPGRGKDKAGAGQEQAAAEPPATLEAAVAQAAAERERKKEAEEAAAAAAAEPHLSLWQKARALVGAFKPAYWQALVVVAVLYFARFDASFLSLRAKQVMPVTAIPIMFLISSLCQAVLTAPLSKISGQTVRNRNALLLVGFLVMVACDAVFALPAFASSQGMFIGAGLLGLHMAMTHSITVSMIASYMPTGEVPGLGKLSGTAVSFTDLLLGFVLAASNAVAGMLSDATKAQGLGNVGCFGGGAAACCLAFVLLLLFQQFGDLGKDELVARRAKKKA